MPEQEQIYPFLTGREFVRLNAILQRLPDPDAADRSRDRDWSTCVATPIAQVGGYSKGMRQRIKVAAALVHDPQVLLMDEPLNGTDPVQRAHLIELIRELGARGKTVLVSSHVLHEVERFAERILVIVHGKLAAAGDFRAIRERIDEHARAVRLRCSDARRLAAALVLEPVTLSVRIEAEQRRPATGHRRRDERRARLLSRRAEYRQARAGTPLRSLGARRLAGQRLCLCYWPLATGHWPLAVGSWENERRAMVTTNQKLPKAKSQQPIAVPITQLTLRAFQGGKAVRVVGLFALIPVLFALIYILDSEGSTRREFMNDMFQEFIAPTILPIAILILATNALGNEIEDRTMVYLVLKPISRLRIVVEKFLAVLLTGSALLMLGIFLTWLLVTRGEAGDNLDILAAMLVAVLFAVLGYGAFFMAVSLIIPRALLVGIIYALVWETTFARFLQGVRLASIRHYVVSIYGRLLDEPLFLPEQAVNLVPAVIIIILAVIGSLALATWRLRTMNLE